MAAWQGWAKQLLEAGKWQTTSANESFLNEWHLYEESRCNNNPMNTTQPWPGSGVCNSVGVRNYPSHAAGIGATLETLHNGYYHFILQALTSGDPWSFKHADGVALDLNTWGSHSFANYYLQHAKNATPPVGSTTGSPAGALSKQAPWQHGWHAVRHATAHDIPRLLTVSKHAREAALRQLGLKGKVK